MPPINQYKCEKCGFALPSGWGGYMYVIDDSGNRIPCPHPGEMRTVVEVLGRGASREKITARTGYNSDCVCLKCLSQFTLDIGDEEIVESSWRYFYGATKRRDRRRCPECGSGWVRTVLELVGGKCPECGRGTIKEFYTGLVS